MAEKQITPHSIKGSSHSDLFKVQCTAAKTGHSLFTQNPV